MNVLMKTNNIEDLALANWSELALASLQKAYDDNEPEYRLDQIKVFNPNFDLSKSKFSIK